MAVAPADLVDIAHGRAVEAPPAADIYTKAADYVAYHTEHKKRIAKLDALENGNWSTVWPDGSVTADMPKIADSVATDMGDLVGLVGGPQPTVVVPPEDDKDSSLRRATLRQNIISTYRHANDYMLTRRKLAMDLIGAGLCCLVVWPNYDSLYPRYIRKDPRNVYPDPSLTSPAEVSSLVVAYKTKTRLLAAAYPNLKTQLFTERELRDKGKELDTSDIEVVEYYDSEWCVKVAGWRSANVGEKKARTITLNQTPNLLGRPLALIAARPTFDGQFRGQFDKSLAPLGTANKMMEMHLAQLADEIYAEKIVRGVWDNPEDIGPGATLYTTDNNAAIERVQPAGSHPQMYGDIQLLLAQSREAAGVPTARSTGQLDMSIGSGALVNALQGKYMTTVETYQALIAYLEERANSRALAVDERYLDAPDKPLVGLAGGRSFSGTYTPSVDIAGHYENRVVYGAGSALDGYNRRLAVIQDVQYGLTSRRTGRAQLDYVEDVIAEEADIAREQMEAGFIQGLSDPNTPLDVRTRALSLTSEGKTPSEIAKILFEESQAAQAQQAANQQAQAELVGPAPQPMAQQGGGQMGPALPRLPALRRGR